MFFLLFWAGVVLLGGFIESETVFVMPFFPGNSLNSERIITGITGANVLEEPSLKGVLKNERVTLKC